MVVEDTKNEISNMILFNKLITEFHLELNTGKTFQVLKKMILFPFIS